MNIEFHYWIILFIARRAGIEAESARKIAHASQLVDERTIAIPVIGPRGSIAIPATQAFTVSAEGNAIRGAFHFVPGDAALASRMRLDGRVNRGVVTPNSPRVKALLINALKTRDLYRIGVALHAYADSWAHAGFCASLDSFNQFYPNDPIPPVGHAAALLKPDLLNEIWIDPRLKPHYSRIDNRDRFIKAARLCYKYLAAYNHQAFDNADMVQYELEELWGPPGKKGRDERYSDYALALHESPFNRGEWFNDAGIDTELEDESESAESEFTKKLKKLARRGGEALFGSRGAEKIALDSGFYKSDLYHWSLAASVHRDQAEKADAAGSI